MAVERKYERDIDIFLAEEFSVSPKFASWFLSKTSTLNDTSATVADVFVSRSDVTGESDLVVIFDVMGGQSFALLIEDKIDASFQPHQYERYVSRAKAAVGRGTFQAFQIVLCAPDNYRKMSPKAELFPSFVSYEEIADAIGAMDGTPRGLYRAAFVRTAASRSANSWERIDDEMTNLFWYAAYDLASREFPILEMKKPRLTKDSNWIIFRPQDFPRHPKKVAVDLKGKQGYVDLTFSNTTAHLFEPQVRAVLNNMTVHQTGRAAAIRLNAWPVVVAAGIEIGIPTVRKSFEAAAKLIAFYRENRVFLDQAAGVATPSD